MQTQITWRSAIKNSFYEKGNLKEVRNALWSPVTNASKTSCSGRVTIRHSSSSFRPNTDPNHPVFFFGLLFWATCHSSSISLGGTTRSLKPLSISIGKEGGISAILDTEYHFWVVKRLRKRARKRGMGHFRITLGMEQNVFSITSADTCNEVYKWVKKRKELHGTNFVWVSTRDVNSNSSAKWVATDDLLEDIHY